MSPKLSPDPTPQPGPLISCPEVPGERRGDLLGRSTLPRSRPIAAASRPARASSSSLAWPTTPGRTAQPRSRRWPPWCVIPACPSGRCAPAWTSWKPGASSARRADVLTVSLAATVGLARGSSRRGGRRGPGPPRCHRCPRRGASAGAVWPAVPGFKVAWWGRTGRIETSWVSRAPAP